MRIAPGGWRYAVPALALGVLAWPLSTLAGALGTGLALGALAFHRDPERRPPTSGVLAPADGRVSVVREERGRVRVGVYMGITDVHVNRAPMAGRVEDTTHTPGANRPAFSKESDRNEKVEIDCGTFTVVQIAGAFARRIHPSVRPGDALDRGERIGHISFGSRVDVLLPTGIDREELHVRKGDRVVAGETVIAALDETPPEGERDPHHESAERSRSVR
jgi:phosphatidylserine decarboxylase